MNVQMVVRCGVIVVGIAATLLVSAGYRKIDEGPKTLTGKSKLYFECMLVAIGITAIYMIIRYSPEVDPIMSWKRIAFLPLLWYIAYYDYKHKLILNEFLLMGIGLRGMLLIPELLIGGRDSLAVIVSELVGALILFLFGIMFRFLSRNGMGAGDVKLFAILPLFMGALGGLRAVFSGMVIIFLAACIFLITKRKGLKDELPFAPSIALGCWFIMFVIYV